MTRHDDDASLDDRSPDEGNGTGDGVRRRRMRLRFSVPGSITIPRGPNVRRLPMLLAAIGVIIALVVGTWNTPSVTGSVFSKLAAPWMPAVQPVGGLTSTWYCPGVPAAPLVIPGDDDDDPETDDRAAGFVVVFNPDEREMRGSLTVLTENDESPPVESFTVAAWSSEEFDLAELVESPYAAAIVEIEGGGGFVEQQATMPLGANLVGDSAAACANSPSDRWYFATGDTSEGSQDLLVLANPHDHSATVDIDLSTSRGPRSVDAFLVPAKSVRTIDMREHTVDDETDVGVSVVASRGTLVAARAQTFSTDTRNGYSMMLGAPALRDQWWFAAGEVADGVTVEYAIYNPGERNAEVTLNPLGYAGMAQYIPEPFTVPRGEVVTVSLDDTDDIPDGPVSAVFSTAEPSQQIVVERVLTREISGVRTSSVTPGATGRVDGYVASRWYVGIGPPVETERALQILNVDFAGATVTVEAITPDGIVPVPGLGEVDLPGSATITVDLTASEAIGNPLIVSSTGRIFVERVFPREQGSQGRVASWLLPQN